MTGRILIADGVPTNRIVLRVRLSSAYYEVAQAGSGAEALQVARRERPDLVIAATDLPDTDGETLCRKLRGTAGLSDTPVILLHPAPDRATRLRLLAAGADDVLARPVDELTLLARLRNLLRARHAEDELRLREDTRRALGLAEPPRAFERPARIALVPVQADIPLRPALVTLHARQPHRFEILDPEQALRDGPTPPEVMVIADTGSRPGAGLSLLTQLRGGPKSRRAALFYATRPDCRSAAASALDLGADDVLAEGFDPEELMLRLPRQIARKRSADRLRDTMRSGLRAAVTDPLTGLHNRRYALPHLARLAERAARQHRDHALILLDLDHFKQINDRHGHAGGDAVLVEVARRLTEGLRMADLVARIGGEEFLVALAGTDAPRALRTAERLRARIADLAIDVSGCGDLVPVSASLGVALASRARHETSEELFVRADRALYAAKRAGRNRVVMADAPPVAAPAELVPDLPRAASALP